MQAEMAAMFGSKAPGHSGDDLLSPNDHLGLTGDHAMGGQKVGMTLAGLGSGSSQSI